MRPQPLRTDLSPRPAGPRHAAGQSGTARGLEGFIALADGARRARTLEIFDPWLAELPDAALAALRERLAALGMAPVVSAGIDMMGPLESRVPLGAARSAPRRSGSGSARCCAATATPGARSGTSSTPASARRSANGGRAPPTRAAMLAIENHQDFTSPELVGFCEAWPRRRHHLRHRQQLPGGRGAARLHRARVAPHVAARAPQGLPGAVHRRGLPPGALRHRRRRGAVRARWCAMLARAPRRADRRARARRAGGAARAASSRPTGGTAIRRRPRRSSPPACSRRR